MGASFSGFRPVEGRVQSYYLPGGYKLVLGVQDRQ